MWDELVPIVNLFITVRQYPKDEHSLDGALLSAVIQEKKLPLLESLDQIAILWAGHQEVFAQHRREQDERAQTGND